MRRAINEGMGAKIIDINFGCPVKKVVNGYAGSALMRDEKKAAEIIEAVVKAVSVPVIAFFTIIRTYRNTLLAYYRHKYISYHVRTIIRKAIQ